MGGFNRYIHGAAMRSRAVIVSIVIISVFAPFCAADDERNRAASVADPKALQQVVARQQDASKTNSKANDTPPPVAGEGTLADPALRAQMRRAVDLGLRFLAKRQNQDDGSFAFSTDESPERRAPFAITALAALAFMADGNTETRGPYARNVKLAISYILKKADFSADRYEAYLGADGDNLSRMHGHGYATLALSQILGMGGIADGSARRDEILKILSAAVHKIESSQGTTGGWYYTPTRNDDHEGSVTITMVQALRAAKDAGITVNSNVIKRAVEYVRKSQKINPAERDNGAFRYRIADRETSVALTVAAISTLNATGDYDSEIIDRAMRYVQSELKTRRRQGYNTNTEKWPYYELLYLAQAFRQFRDPDVFAGWYRGAVVQLISSQKILEHSETREEIGFWNDPYGRVFGTSVCVIVLRTEDSYLPILQR